MGPQLLGAVGLGLVAVSFVLSAGLCALVRICAPRLGFLDRPGGHKGHGKPVPLGGGLAIWLTTVGVTLVGAVAAVALSRWLPPELAKYADGVRSRSGELFETLGLASAVMVMGLVDDRKGLGWRLRLGVQFGLAGVLAASGVRVTLFGLGPYFGGLVTVCWVVGLTNAFNFLDNMDGLAAGVGLTAALLFAGAQVAVGSLFVPGVLLALVGALGGFLVHNRFPARLYMGDAGSHFLGFVLGAMTVAGTYYRYDRPVSPYSVLAPLLVMAVPLYDSASVILIRLREGRSPFEGDRSHLSHRLVGRGLTPKQAVRTIVLVTLVGGLGALLLHRLDVFGAAVVVAQTVCLLGLVAILEVSATGPESDRSGSGVLAMARQKPGQAAAPDSNPVRPPRSRAPGPAEALQGDDPDAYLAAWLGERLRRVALGATAALLTARAFWASEPDLAADAGGGLVWVLALMVVAGLALAGALAGGHQRWRWSWADAGVVALVALVGASAGHAVDRRVAINLAWEWGGFGVAYLLVRNLPRTRGESTALLGALAATAVAVAVYGFYQIGVELPDHQRRYMTSPAYREMAWRVAGVVPGTAGQVQLEYRLLHSNEPYSTFALANSLAGFLVGPMVLMLATVWDNLTRREGKGSRLAAVLLALPPVAAVLVCLTLTKSRSAWVGLAVGVLALAWRERTRVRGRTLALAAAVVLAVVAALAVAGLATGRLDRQVASESGKSFRYRREYWVGTWRAITESPGAFWGGFGPGNLHAPYLRHKLPEASEEIHDPHNLVLEVWATAGVWAVAALGVALAFGLGNTFGRPARAAAAEPDGAGVELRPVGRAKGPPDPASAPASAGWLVASAAGGWLVVVLLGRLNPFVGDGFERWLILGGAWALAAGLGVSLARRRPIDGAAAGAAALAVLVNLTAAGGIGIPTVALALWTTLALGLNLRDDRPCGRARGPIGRLPAFALAAVWVALLGTFVGAVTPYWKAEAALADAGDALLARPPDFARAEAAYDRAKDADAYSARPWLALAGLEYERWKGRGFRFEDQRWRKIPIAMLKAVTKPRPPDSWSRHRERARMTRLLIQQLGGKLSPLETTRYRGDVVNASRRAVALYPTNPALRAALAEASAEIGMIPDALDEGREALRLDRLLDPHPDKRLEPSVRVWLGSKIPAWEGTAEKARQAQPTGSKGKG